MLAKHELIFVFEEWRASRNCVSTFIKTIGYGNKMLETCKETSLYLLLSRMIRGKVTKNKKSFSVTQTESR